MPRLDEVHIISLTNTHIQYLDIHKTISEVESLYPIFGYDEVATQHPNYYAGGDMGDFYGNTVQIQGRNVA